MSLLSEIISSQVRTEIFKLLFDNSLNSYHLRDVQRKSKLALRTIQKELIHLRKLDLIVAEKDGNRLYFTANNQHPLYSTICTLVEKTSGIPQLLQDALADLADIKVAFAFGSIAKNTEKSHSDVDLIVIGNVGLRNLSSKLRLASEKIGREINPHIYSVKSWQEKIKKKDHFILSIREENKIFLIGDEHVLRELA